MPKTQKFENITNKNRSKKASGRSTVNKAKPDNIKVELTNVDEKFYKNKIAPLLTESRNYLLNEKKRKIRKIEVSDVAENSREQVYQVIFNLYGKFNLDLCKEFGRKFFFTNGKGFQLHITAM